MSHFSVLVVTDSKPTHDDLKRILQPWHEYECTGEDDEYVIDVDVTDEVMEQWKRSVSIVRLSDGTIKSRYDDFFYTKPPTKKFGRKEFELPAGATLDEIPQSDMSAISGETIEEFAEYYGGWKRKEDGRFYDRTNPNKKWDWWQVGGRYSGELIVNLGADAVRGERSWTNENEVIDGHDAARIGDLDFDGMAKYQRNQRRSWIHDIIQKSDLTHAEVEAGIHADRDLHELWMTLPKPRPRGAEYRLWQEENGAAGKLAAKVGAASWDRPSLKSGQTIDTWIAAAPALTSWAVVKDGKWAERGEMGWFGMSSGDMPEDEWHAIVTKMVSELPPDSWITVVDCHI